MTSNEEIKQAAFHLFATKGYECTSMQDIARAVGLKKQSLYSHFAGKQELYGLILKEQAEIVISGMHIAIERLENEPTEALLKGIFKSLIQIFSCKERLLLWKRGFMIHGYNDAAMTAQPDGRFDEKLSDRLYNIIRVKHDRLSPETFRWFFLSYMLSIQGYFDWMIAIGHSEELFESFWKNIWCGMHQCID
jgi:AcrR family transcriptional regulator